MISAAEARDLTNNISQLQLEQIERCIKEAILNGRTSTSIYYKTGYLSTEVLGLLKTFGYFVSTKENSLGYSDTEISWGINI